MTKRKGDPAGYVKTCYRRLGCVCLKTPPAGPCGFSAANRDAAAWKRDYLDGLSIPKIAAARGVPRSTVRKALLALGVTLRSRREGFALAMMARRGYTAVPLPNNKV